MTAITTRINDIDTASVQQLIDNVQRDPTNGMARFEVATRWTGGFKTRTSVDRWSIGGQTKPRGFVIETDEPPELAGESAAANPQEVLMAGLNACMSVGYIAGCSMLGIEVTALEIRSEGTLDLRGFLGLDAAVKPGYEQIECTVTISGSGTPEQFQQVHEMVKATSPNFFNITNPVRVRPTLVVK